MIYDGNGFKKLYNSTAVGRVHTQWPATTYVIYNIIIIPRSGFPPSCARNVLLIFPF